MPNIQQRYTRQGQHDGSVHLSRCGGHFGDIRFEDEDQGTLLNPRGLVEVLFKFTESYDRGEKFAHYRRLESVTDYLLISQNKVRVEHYTRHPDRQWLLTEIGSITGQVVLPSVDCALLLADLYDKVEFASDNETSNNRGTA